MSGEAGDVGVGVVIAPVGVALLGGLGMVMAGGYGVSTLVGAGALLVLSLGVGAWSRGWQGRVVEQAVAASRKDLEPQVCARKASCITGLDKLYENVLPIWSGQIELARSITDESAQDLVARFAAITQRLEATMAASQSAAGGMEGGVGLVSLLKESEQELHTIVTSLQAVLEAKESLLQEVTALSSFTEHLKAMAKDVGDIAKQTNLLALNAAIEAARAGEAGRGFAVVADEVRKLAEKTMNATKEVGQAITGIQQGTADAVTRVDRAVNRVGTASELAGRSGAALAEIVSEVEVAGDQVRAIAAAAEQQSATSEEINRSVESISAIAAETAQAMHQSAEAMKELARQAQELNSLMSELQDGNAGQKALA